MELLKPFAVNGEREDFSVDTDPDGKVSLDRGFTQLYELRPTEGGLFILRKIFNQMMYLVTNDAVKWKTQTFANWIEDKGDGTPYAYPKNAIVKYTDGNSYVSRIEDNVQVPTTNNAWLLYNFDINSLTEKVTPVDTDVIQIQESGGLFKKLSFANLMTWVKSFSFGWGQTWQNVTSSRSSGVTYTNNTNKPIMVSVMSTEGSSAYVTIYLNGISATQSSFYASNGIAGDTLIVPVGFTYSVSAIPGVETWYELR